MSPRARHEGYFAVGIVGGKSAVNVGTLWRSAWELGAAFIFTVGARHPQQASDTVKSRRRMPYFELDSVEQLYEHFLPDGCQLVGVELVDGAKLLGDFRHPERAAYLLGAEDHGLSPETLRACHHVVRLPGGSLNVAVAGSIVAYDRLTRGTA